MSAILSIIVPVYNSGKYLRDCLNSISDQSFKDFECILVDDGSNDESPIICDEYASADPRFFCIHKKNEGALSARFEGLKKASSKFVSFIDSDDFIEADMYETLMGELSKNKADIICSGHYVYESSNSSPLQYLNIAKEGVYEGKTLESLTENKPITWTDTTTGNPGSFTIASPAFAVSFQCMLLILSPVLYSLISKVCLRI